MTSELNEILRFPNKIMPYITGIANRNIKLIQNKFSVGIYVKGNEITVVAKTQLVKLICTLLYKLADRAERDLSVDEEDVLIAIKELEVKEKILKNDNQIYSINDNNLNYKEASLDDNIIATAKKMIIPRSEKQQEYIKAMSDKHIVFAIGPAGTGKTYLAVAKAVELMQKGIIERLIITRPVVEAGENLGFLPGDVREKVDPYMRPIYDALSDVLSTEKVERKIINREIEIAPLAFMRGRTLSNSFIILDEAQNTTTTQMKMFLTRLGQNSKMLINGDLTQIDLPKGRKSGLSTSCDILSNVPDISIVKFSDEDVVRHTLVKKIVSAYEKYTKEQ